MIPSSGITTKCSNANSGAVRKTLLLSASLISAAMFAQPVLAQESAEEAEDNGGLNVIVVTAERRTQNSQDVPLALTTFGGDEVKPGGIDGIDDIAIKTPNLKITTFNIGEPQIFMRGLGSTVDSAGSDPSVAVFVDDVYIGRSGGSAFDLYDLDRIEVLRGPQGTLYGRNVVGGAISVYSKKPQDEFEAKVGLTVGNYDLSVIQGYVTGPIAEGINGKLAFSRRDRGGYSTNLITNQELDDAGSFSLRGQLLFEPTDRTEILVSADYGRDRTNGKCRTNANLDGPGQNAGGVFVPQIKAAQAALGITGPRQCAFDTIQFCLLYTSPSPRDRG